jgi:hypothetical protein
MPDHSTQTQKHLFKIKATARGGATVESKEINIKLKNCDNIAPELLSD